MSEAYVGGGKELGRLPYRHGILAPNMHHRECAARGVLEDDSIGMGQARIEWATPASIYCAHRSVPITWNSYIVTLPENRSSKGHPMGTQ